MLVLWNYHNDNQQAIEGLSNPNLTQQVSLFADPSRRCCNDAHNTLDGHSGHSVNSFFSSKNPLIPCFILDSGSNSHMMSNINLFISLDSSEEGIVCTSSGSEALKIKGIGTINLVNKYDSIILNKVLYVPELFVNLLSVRCLVLNNFLVKF
ncbi:hypothetical protein VP01_910g1 [Puccinia sorghi]|uniref:Retrovirus-related Pol polyprotein from transposon TNT 1-94-like beta-barrel domain-containing protein n=1 Tax=Puccinia sorghi TaxID=27349 RepID=A0A0L6U861_9BASI|nr:hypothetical protein VP01_910g1 [Puccinia sorghi]